MHREEGDGWAVREGLIYATSFLDFGYLYFFYEKAYASCSPALERASERAKHAAFSSILLFSIQIAIRLHSHTIMNGNCNNRKSLILAFAMIV